MDGGKDTDFEKEEVFTPAGPGDKLGAAETEGVEADPNRSLRNRLAYAKLVIVLLAVALILDGAAFNAMLPLKREVPYLYQMSANGKGLESFDRLNIENSRIEDLARMELLQYIRIRHTIVADSAEMDRRFYNDCKENYTLDAIYCAHIPSRSADDVYEEFIEELEYMETAIQAFQSQGKIRNVEFDSGPPKVTIKPGPAGDFSDIFQFDVNFTLVDLQRDERTGALTELRRQPMQAVVETAYTATPSAPGEEKFINPSGFMVGSYFYTKIGAAESRR